MGTLGRCVRLQALMQQESWGSVLQQQQLLLVGWERGRVAWKEVGVQHLGREGALGLLQRRMPPLREALGPHAAVQQQQGLYYM